MWIFNTDDQNQIFNNATVNTTYGSYLYNMTYIPPATHMGSHNITVIAQILIDNSYPYTQNV